MTKQQQQLRNNISKFIRKVAERSSTEGLIAFIAGNFGMLPACRKVLDLLAVPDSTESEWLQEQCHKSHISSQLLQSESERILSIFQPGLSHDEQYDLLGLTPEATISEVKSAFRKLSFRYHPDSATTQNPDDSEKFIAICRAYKKILRTETDEIQLSTPNNSESAPWRHDHESRQPSKQKRKTIFLIAAITIALLFVSLSATRSYRKKAMLKSLGHTQKVAVAKPPRPETTTLAKVSETTKPPAKPVVPKAIPPTPKAAEKPITIAKKTTIPNPVVKKQIPRKSITTTLKPKKTIRPIVRPSVTTNTPAAKETSKSTPLPSPPKPSTVAKKQIPKIPPAPEPIKVVAVNIPQPQTATAFRTTKTTKPPAKPVAPKTTPPTPEPQPLTLNPPRTAAPDKTTPVAPPPLRTRIDTFLTSYSNAYELLNVNTFTTFFTADAVENGTPFKEKFSQYRKLFSRLKIVSYKVTLRSWHIYNELIYLSCRFHVYFLYANGEEINLHGPTSFQLHEDRDNHLKVKNLTYSFD